MSGVLEIIYQPTNEKQEHAIDFRPVIMGRSPACDIVLESPEISRRHCMVEVRDNKYWLVDLASANGTCVNALPIKEKNLESGDIITLGKSDKWEIRFTLKSLPIKEEHPAPHQIIADDTTRRTKVQKPISGLPSPLESFTSEHTLSKTSHSGEKAPVSTNPLNILIRLSRIMMSSLELERLLELLMEEIMSLSEADRGCIVFMEESKTASQHQYSIKAYKQKASLPKAVVPELQISRTIVEHAIDKQMAMLLTDLENQEDFQSVDTVHSKGIRSSLCVPIKGKDKILGVIYLDSQSGTESFDEDDLDLITAISNQAGIAIENAIFWEKMRRYNEELETEVTQRTAEIALERNRLKAILSCMGEGVVVSDPADKIILVNPTAQKIFSFKSDTTLSGNVLNWYPSEVRQMAERLMKLTENFDGETELFEEIKVAMEEKHLRLNMAPIIDDKKSYMGMVLVNQDITKEVEIEQMKADFISMLTHDMKNPLTVVMTSAQLISKGYLGPLNPKLEQQVKAIYRNAQTMLELVNNFLDISKIEAGRMTLGRQPVSMTDLVETVLQNFRNQAEEAGVDLIKEIPAAGLPKTTGDPFQLERVLTNLVSNAMKFTSHPGYVIIKGEQEENFIKISVTDSGEGIPAEEIPNLFSRYFRTKSVQGKVKGTGLGLYIVRSIVESHEGKVDVTSELGKGTIFSVWLPIISPDENSIQPS